MFSLLVRLLPPAVIFSCAQHLRSAGRLDTALATADLGLEKLRRKAPDGERLGDWIAQGCALRGTLLLELGRSGEAFDALVRGRKHLASEPRSCTFLIDTVLRRKWLTAEALEIIVEYLARPPDGEDAARRSGNLALIESLTRPVSRTAAELERSRRWNEAIVTARPELPWPYIHLGVLYSLANMHGRAATALRRACERDSREERANALLAHVLARNGDSDESRAVLSILPTSSRAVMLLRAEVFRELGDARAAAEWFRLADAVEPLDTRSLLALGEALINAGERDAARRLLTRIPDDASARRALLAAAVCESSAEAIRLLRRLRTDRDFGGEAILRLLAIVQREPAVTGAIEALLAVPDAQRDGPYWMVRCNAHQEAGDSLGAVDAIGHLKRIPVALAKRATQLFRMWLANQDGASVLRCIASELPRGVRAPELQDVAARAAIEVAAAALDGKADLAEAVQQIEAAMGVIEDLDERGDVRAALGILYAARGEHSDAIDSLEGALELDYEAPGALLQLARSSLLEGNDVRARELLDDLDPDDARVARVAAAVAAVDEQWPDALKRIDASDADEPFCIAALCHLSNAHERLRLRASSDPAHAYFAAVAAARRKDLDAAERLCRRAPEAMSRSLTGWIAVQRALTMNDPRARSLAIAHGLAQWSVAEPRLCGPLLPLFLSAAQRQEIIRSLEALDGSPSDGCHRLGIAHLAAAARAADAGDWPEAHARFEQSFAHFCVALADRDSLRAWTQRRISVYRSDDNGEHDLGSRVVDRLQRVLRRWEKLPGADADAIARIELSFRAELRAAQLARDADLAVEGMFAGPAYVAMRGWEAQLAAALDDLDEESGDDFLQILRRLVTGGGARLPDERIEKLRRFYSSLRIAALLNEDGHPHEALALLRTAENDEEQKRFMVELLLQTGEREIASTAERLDAGIANWSEALALSDERRHTEQRIREIAIGRTQVLDQHDREEEAIALLERVYKLCGDDDIEGHLAMLHAHLGVRRANESNDWQVAVDELRKARKLNPSSTYIDRNLVTALANRAGDLAPRDARRSRALLTEAVEIGQANLALDPHNGDWQELMKNVRRALMMVRAQQGNATAADVMEAMMFASVGSARLSVVYHNRGIDNARQGHYDEAIHDLTKALELEPSSEATREALAAVRMTQLLDEMRSRLR